MTRRGAATAAVLALLALPGCRALSVGSLDRPGIGDPVMDQTTREVVEALNENARGVESLSAKVSVRLSGRITSAAKGKLMMQRPRDFKLVLHLIAGGEVANIGSNSEGFWFWTHNRDDPSIYTCKYDADGKTPVGVPITMQPDWIVEAIGLREITQDEAKNLKATRGDQPGTLVLRGKRPAGDGQFYMTETVISAETKRIISHTILAPDRKTVLTRADLKDYATDGAEPASGGAAPVLPSRIVLTWAQQGMTLDVSLKDFQLNASFPENQFAELSLPNAVRRDLATLAGPAASGEGSTAIRESRPSPPASRRRGLFSRDTVPPIGDDGASNGSSDPKPLDADLPQLPGAPSASSATFVTTPLPQPPADPPLGVTTREARRPAWISVER